jgi:hypothetical protein
MLRKVVKVVAVLALLASASLGAAEAIQRILP